MDVVEILYLFIVLMSITCWVVKTLKNLNKATISHDYVGFYSGGNSGVFCSAQPC